MQIVIGGKGGKLMGLCWTPAQLTDLDSFSNGDQVPLDLPLGTIPRPPHLGGKGVRAWEFHQKVVVEDKSASVLLITCHPEMFSHLFISLEHCIRVVCL